jgi:surfeit locus 1 family protein
MIVSTLKILFSRRLLIPTLLVISAIGVMARLGIWQLDRLTQRRAQNAIEAAQLNAPLLDLNQALTGAAPTPIDSIVGMQYRSVVVRGSYEFSRQVGLRNQVWSDQLGYDLLTPLRISGSGQIVLIDRGWIPREDFESGRLAQYDEPGEVTVQGVILDSQVYSALGHNQDPVFDPARRTTAFFAANPIRIGQEMAYSLLPVYIQQIPDPARSGLPYRKAFNLVLNDGPHLSYAIQWFFFALVLGVGYPILVRRNVHKDPKGAADLKAGIRDVR